jgi:hypothetical protein
MYQTVNSIVKFVGIYKITMDKQPGIWWHLSLKVLKVTCTYTKESSASPIW